VFTDRYLLEKGARLDAVNNDGELAIDLADGTDMTNLLSDAMETQGAIKHATLSARVIFVSPPPLVEPSFFC